MIGRGFRSDSYTRVVERIAFQRTLIEAGDRIPDEADTPAEYATRAEDTAASPSVRPRRIDADHHVGVGGLLGKRQEPAARTAYAMVNTQRTRLRHGPRNSGQVLLRFGPLLMPPDGRAHHPYESLSRCSTGSAYLYKQAKCP